MGRTPCCSKVGLKRGSWTAVEDKILTDYIKVHGEGKWRSLPRRAGLMRCGKSCRLRWLNYLRPDIKRGNISHDEEDLIIRLHKLLGNRWSLIAGRLPGRTDNEIKNYWNTTLGKRVLSGHPNSPSAHKGSNQSYSKDKKVGGITPVDETHHKNESNVIRTKAVRCSKVLFCPRPPRIELTYLNNRELRQSNSVTNPLLIESFPCYGITPFNSEENHNPSDYLLDIDVGEESIWELLNTDFSGERGFNQTNNDSDNNASSSLNGSILTYPKELLEDCSVRDCVQPCLASTDDHHFLDSILESESDWLVK